VATVKMFAPAGSGGSIQTNNSGTVFVQSDGTVTVNALDALTLIALGYQFAVSDHRCYSTPLWGSSASVVAGMPAANATIIAGSAALSNGSVTISAQPDVPRQLQFVVIPGTSAITAGSLTVTYVGNDGQTHADALSLVTAASTNSTITTTWGVETLTSAVVAGLTGGASPTLMGGTNNAIAVPLPPRAVDFALTKVLVDGVNSTTTTVTTSTGLVTLATAPNGLHQYGLGYSFVYPG
jgi:hypothetical protein